MQKSTEKKIKIAVFDIDGTIFRSSLLIELFNSLVRTGIFPKKASAEVEREYLAWLDRKGHYNKYLGKLIKVHYKYQKGCTVQSVKKVMQKVIQWQKDRVYRYTRNLIKNLRKNGYFLLAISNSQDYMVEYFGKTLGFNVAIGRTLEVENGKYTGRMKYKDKRIQPGDYLDKAEIFKDFIEQSNMNIDLKKSVAVGDSESDIPLLDCVGNPIAFNPSSPLARHAQKHGWMIVVERKDIMYHIKNCRLLGEEDNIDFSRLVC